MKHLFWLEDSTASLFSLLNLLHFFKDLCNTNIHLLFYIDIRQKYSHINYKNFMDLTTYYILLHWHGEERYTFVYGTPYKFLCISGTHANPSKKTCTRKYLISDLRLYIHCQRHCCLFLWWCLVWGDCYRHSCTCCSLLDKFIYFCLQLSAAIWHPLIPRSFPKLSDSCYSWPVSQLVALLLTWICSL